MGTFHHDRGPLHGITVVVEVGNRIWVGRCHEMDERQILLLDADVHDPGADGLSREEYLRRATRFGVWKKHDQVVIPRADVQAVTPLGDIAKSFAKNLAKDVAKEPPPPPPHNAVR